MNNPRAAVFKEKPSQPSKRCRNLLAFIFVVVVWLGLDIATKQYVDGFYRVGAVITEPIFGLFRFILVHNPGAAWGMFGDSTTALGVVSLIVCIVIFGYFYLSSPQASVGEVLGLALVFSGGVGNAIDRFSAGYVVDFIEFTFIDFPVFNIADIGVTCGFIILVVSMLFAWSRENKLRKEAERLKTAARGGSIDSGIETFDSQDEHKDA